MKNRPYMCEDKMSRFFNTAGPIVREDHYFIEPLKRIDLDEIDTLVGDTLISVLRQLCSGYPMRPGMFPQSIILCGVRDVRDYRLHSGNGKAMITGGSAFNIKAESFYPIN
jgi:hypothetical protein